MTPSQSDLTRAHPSTAIKERDRIVTWLRKSADKAESSVVAHVKRRVATYIELGEHWETERGA